MIQKAWILTQCPVIHVGGLVFRCARTCFLAGSLLHTWKCGSVHYADSEYCPPISGGQCPSSICLVVPHVLVCITCSVLLILWTALAHIVSLPDSLCHSLPSSLFVFELFEVLDCLPSLPLISFEFCTRRTSLRTCVCWLNMCCIVTQGNVRTTSSTQKNRYSSSSVWSHPAECICRASVQGRDSHSHRNALETLKCHSTDVALSRCQFASLE